MIPNFNHDVKIRLAPLKENCYVLTLTLLYLSYIETANKAETEQRQEVIRSILFLDYEEIHTLGRDCKEKVIILKCANGCNS